MPPPLSPIWILVPVLVMLLCVMVMGTIDLVKQGRLRGYSIGTHFLAVSALVGMVLIGHFMPPRWHNGGKYWLTGICFMLYIGFGAVTKKWPAPTQEKRWKKAIKRSLS